jgi:hypothetical protein
VIPLEVLKGVSNLNAGLDLIAKHIDLLCLVYTSRWFQDELVQLKLNFLPRPGSILAFSDALGDILFSSGIIGNILNSLAIGRWTG